MSNPDERDDAPDLELEETVDVEEQGADGAGSDEDGADALGEEPGEGDVDSEQEDDAGEDDGASGQPSQVAGKGPGRRELAVIEAKKKTKEAAERADRAEARLAEIERERTGQRTAEEQRLEAARLELMSPEEKTAYEVGKVRQETRNEIGALRFQMWDSADRTSFDGLCARSPAFESVRDDVERQAEQMRKAGQAVPERKVLATYFIGQRAIERATKGGAAKQKKRGAENVQRQQGKPSGGRSDVAGGRERSGGSETSARWARLENLDI